MSRLGGSGKPVPAKTLAGELNVSRQVIVQDVALLRASGHEIISTNRGYVLAGSAGVARLLKTFHTNEQLEDELFTIVDLGGEILNVIVNHRVYGKVEASLNIASRRDVREFISDIESGRSAPLMNVTSNYHFHLIKAPSAEVMTEIIEALDSKGYLIEVMDGEMLWKE